MRRGMLRAWMGALLAAGCAGGQVEETREAPLEEPAFEFRGVGFEYDGFMGMQLVLKFELISRDPRTISLVACPYELELEGMHPVTGTVTPRGTLAGNSRIPVHNRIDVPWPKDPSAIQQFLGQGKIPYKFTQTCNATGPQGPLSLSASDAGSLPLPGLPELTVSGANAERFGGKDIRLNFELAIVNQNPFKMQIDKIEYRVEVEGKPMAEGQLTVAESVPPSNEVSYDISTRILSGEESQEINQLVKRPSIEYHLVGKVTSGEFEIPVDATGTITFPH